MDDRARQIAALLRETYKQLPITGETGFDAVAIVLAPMAEDIAALKAERKPQAAPAPVPQTGATRGAEVAADMVTHKDHDGIDTLWIRSQGLKEGGQLIYDNGKGTGRLCSGIREFVAAAIDAERAAARRAAIDEAEGAVEEYQRSLIHEVSQAIAEDAAAAVARLREVPAHEEARRG